MKASDWQYENEYRLILQEVDVVVKFPNEIYNRVVLGRLTSDENRQQIIDILTRRGDDSPLYQAKRAKKSFSLVFTKIPYQVLHRLTSNSS